MSLLRLLVRSWPALMLLAVLACLVGLSHPVHAQDAADEEVADEVPTEDDDAGDLSLDEMLSGDELRTVGYTYDPGGRRDPFKSLLASRQGPFLRGPRPEGIPGLLIDEVDLTGLFLTQDGPVAQVLSTEQENSFLLREGDQLYDGDVVSISNGEVVFRQIVDDPAAIKPFREVVKKLNP